MTDTIYVAQQSLQDYGNLTSSYTSKDIIFIIIAVLNLLTLAATIYYIYKSPIVAVETAEYLQKNRADSDRVYQNKFSIFATILGLRHSRENSEQFVIAINQIPIVFHDNKEVLVKLDRYIKTHSDIFNPVEQVLSSLNLDLNDLVLELAKDLGYSNIDNNVMKTYYNPDASFFRYQSEAMYSELYYFQKLDELASVRKMNDNRSNSPQGPR